MAATRHPAFHGFGDSVLIPAVRRPLVQITIAEDREQSRRNVRELAPAAPGVYGWVDRNQQLLYVGKSKSLRLRLLSYFDRSSAEPKHERMRRLSSRIVWEAVSHDLLSLIREQELIYRWRPSFNRMGQPERRQPGFICVTEGVAPRAVVTTDAGPRARFRFGPLVGLNELRHAVDQLNYVFGLRDCSDRTPMQLSRQLPLFGNSHHAQCLRYELQTCLGPCAGACSAHRYGEAVQRAVAFLRGDDLTILDQLQREMESAAARLAFERAGILLEQIRSLNWLARRIAMRQRLREQLSGVFPIPSFDRQPCRLILEQGFFAGMHHGNGSLLASTSSRKLQPREDALAIEWMLIIAAWFRKHSDQRSLIERIPRRVRRIRASA